MVNPLQSGFINQSAAVPGYALRKAYDRKMASYGVQGGRISFPALADGHNGSGGEEDGKQSR